MAFKAMDQELARRLIQQHEDVITPAAKVEAEVYRNARCPVCGHVGAQKVTMAPKVVPTPSGPQALRAPFSGATPLVVGHAQCETCRTEYSPTTGVIIRQSEPILSHPGFTDE